MSAYYNEFNSEAVEWLRNLIREDLIAPGDVDERSINDICADDLRGYTQCHFFAGIGVWSYALRQAGWRDDRPVWTGSCPCQSFSDAGKGRGFADERHLWPAWFHFISQCRPDTVFGEQVEAAIRFSWLDLIQSDLEGLGYAVAPVVLPAAGFGAPQGRHRLWFVGDAIGKGLEGHSGHVDDGDKSGRLNAEPGGPTATPGPVNGFWAGADWLPCRDGKARPVEPGLEPLVDGASSRLVRLRAYGNSIVAPVAEAVIRAYMEIRVA